MNNHLKKQSFPLFAELNQKFSKNSAISDVFFLGFEEKNPPITESIGILNREVGDEFKSEDGLNVLYFIEATSFSEEKEYNTYIADKNITPQNKKQENRNIARVITLNTQKDGKGETKYIVFWRKERESRIPNEFSIDGKKYILNTSSSVSEQIKMQPSDLAKGNPLTIQGVIDLFDGHKEGPNRDIAINIQNYLIAVRGGKGNGYEIQNIPNDGTVEFYRKYLGEWAAPIALIWELGLDIDTNETKIKYPSSKNQKLVDSEIISENANLSIKISSKSNIKNKVSSTSLSSLFDLLDAGREGFFKISSKLLKKPSVIELLEILNVIKNNSAINGPLILAKRAEIISDEEEIIIKKLAKNKPDTLTEDETKTLQGLKAEDRMDIKEEGNIGYRLLEKVCKKLCEKLNSREEYGINIAKILTSQNVTQSIFNTKVIFNKEKEVNPYEITCQSIEFSDLSGINQKGVFTAEKGYHSNKSPDNKIGFYLKPANISEFLQEKRGIIFDSLGTPLRDPSVPDKIALGRSLKSAKKKY